MALFNVQFISTIATVFFVSRIASFVSLPHRLLAGLEYCLVPTDTTPKNASGTKASGGKRKREAEKKSMVVLRVTTLQSHALDEHFFFEELNTLLCALVSGYAMIAFGNVLQCAMHGVRAQSTTPANDMSFIALAIIAIYCLKVMLSSLAHTGSESYEMRLSILCGIVGAAVCLFVIESASFLLDFPFSAAFAEVCASWDVYASTHPMLTTVLGERVRIQWLYPWYRALLAFLGGLIASLLFFPAFRQARCHHLLQSDSSNIKANTFFTNLLSSLNFLFPLVLAILWIKPLSRDLYTIDASSSLSLKEGQFSALRLWLVVGMCLLRLKLIFPYVQVFVLQSVQYAEMIMDSNKRDVLPKIQRKVMGLYAYICVVTVQLLAPTLLLSTFALLGLSQPGSSLRVCEWVRGRVLGDATEIPDAVSQALLSPLFVRTTCSFLLWWSLICWVVVSLVALVYERALAPSRAAA